MHFHAAQALAPASARKIMRLLAAPAPATAPEYCLLEYNISSSKSFISVNIVYRVMHIFVSNIDKQILFLNMTYHQYNYKFTTFYFK
jgi:hypothetical protein